MKNKKKICFVKTEYFSVVLDKSPCDSKCRYEISVNSCTITTDNSDYILLFLLKNWPKYNNITLIIMR